MFSKNKLPAVGRQVQAVADCGTAEQEAGGEGDAGGGDHWQAAGCQQNIAARRQGGGGDVKFWPDDDGGHVGQNIAENAAHAGGDNPHNSGR